MMLYTLTRKNPAEAEAWLKTFQARPDVDDFTVDVDELKAVVEKGKVAR
jgi:predicted RNA-binding protein associated with RNAse of E/G family